MKTKDNYIINEDFTDRENSYYIIFKTPDDITKRIEDIQILQLKRITNDSVELLIKNKNKTYIYHYIDEYIHLLDHLDIGF